MSHDTSPAGAAASEHGPAAGKIGIYYTLLITQGVSLIGSQISGYAVSIAVFQASGHTTPLALVAFFQVLPAVLIGGFAGALADRFDRRSVMLTANVGYAITSALLLASFASGAFQIWHLYTLSFASAALAALERPAFQASIAMLVPPGGRDRANAVGQMTGPLAGAIAPALAGMLYAIAGVAGSIVIDIATFFVAIAVLIVVRIPMPRESDEGRAMRAPLWRQVFDGFRYLAARPPLLAFCLFISVVNFIANTAFVLLTPYALDRTGDTRLLGAVLAVMNVGAIAGSLALSAGARIGSRINTSMLGLAAAAVFMSLAGTAQGAITLGASLFLVMVALMFCNVPYSTMLQAKIPPDIQGRVFAANGQIAMLMGPAAFLIAGPLADRVFEPARLAPAWRSVAWLVGDRAGAGMGLMFVVAGVLVLLLTLAVYAVPAIRRLETTLPDHVPNPVVAPADG